MRLENASARVAVVCITCICRLVCLGANCESKRIRAMQLYQVLWSKSSLERNRGDSVAGCSVASVHRYQRDDIVVPESLPLK
jgi:hypothetical protein